MPAELRSNIRVKSSISEKQSKDGKKHIATRVLPAVTLDKEDIKAFAAAVVAYVENNKAIMAGEDITLHGSGGKTKTVKSTDNDKDMFDGPPRIYRGSLPTTLSDVVDLINAGLVGKHRNQIGAALTAEFSKNAKASESKSASDDIDDIV